MKQIIAAFTVVLLMAGFAFAIDECSTAEEGGPNYGEGCDQPIAPVDEEGSGPPSDPFICDGIRIPSCTCFGDFMAIPCLLVFCNTDCCLAHGVCTTTN